MLPSGPLRGGSRGYFPGAPKLVSRKRTPCGFLILPFWAASSRYFFSFTFHCIAWTNHSSHMHKDITSLQNVTVVGPACVMQNQIAGIPGKLLFSPSKSYTCASVVDHKRIAGRDACAGNETICYGGNNCSWSALEASHFIHEVSWPTPSLHKQPGLVALPCCTWDSTD